MRRLVFTLLVLGCSPDPMGTFRKEAALVRNRLVPAGATVTKEMEPTREGLGVVVAWDIETTSSWGAYRSACLPEFDAGFRPDPAAEGRFGFVRARLGELQILDVERDEEGPPLRVRATFKVVPD